MNKRVARLLVPLLFLAVIYAMPAYLSQTHALTPGLICIAAVSDSACPASPPTFTGAVTSPTPTQLKIAIRIQGSESLNGFDVTLLSDRTKLEPADADFAGTIVPGPITVLGKCIGGIAVSGSCGPGASADPSALQLALVGSLATGPVSGLLFIATYNIVGTTTAPVTIGYKDGCTATTSSSGTLCVAISNGTIIPVPETVQTGAFDNSAAPIPGVTITSSVTNFGQVFVADVSNPFTVSVTPNGGYEAQVDASVSLAATAGDPGITATFTPSIVDLSGGLPVDVPSNLGVASTVVPGSYLIPVTATYHVSAGGIVSTLAYSVSIPITVVDFNFAASASAIAFWFGQTGTATLTVSSAGYTGAVAIATVNITPASTPALAVNYSPASVPGGSGTSTATFSGGKIPPSNTLGQYTVSTRGTGTLTSGTRQKTVSFTVKVQDFNITSSVPTVTFDSGLTGTATLALGSLPSGTAAAVSAGGFAGPVTLSVTSITPSTGLAANFGTNPVTLTAGHLATSVVTFSGTVPSTTTFTVVITGTATIGSSTQTHSVTIMVTVNFVVTADFTIAPSSPVTVTANAGSTGSQTITITPTGTFTGTVTFTVSASSPAGLICGTPAAVTGGSGTSTLSCSASVAGDYVVTVTGTSGSLSHTTAAITFHVVDYTIAAGAVTPSQILAGSSGTSTITVTALNGFTGTVTLSVSASTPAGLTCTLPASVTFGASPQTATLSCSATVAGDYTVTATGASGTLSHTTATILFHVTDYTLAAGAVSPSQIFPGASGTSTITVTALNSFTGTVTLSVSASSPAGLTCTLPASVIFGASPQTATLSCSAAATGDYTVTVAGVSGTLSHTTPTILFHVVDFNIAAGAVSPSQILAGASGTSTITVTAVNGFTGTVTLTVSASTPAGLTCTLAASVTFGASPQTATLSCSAIVAGDYTVTVTGASGARSKNTTPATLFHVVDYTIAPSSPVTVTGIVNSPITQTITLTAVNGFTGTVNLSVSPSTPSGLTCTLPASVLFGGSPQTATLSCSASVANTSPGYVVTVTGTSGTLSHTTASITFAVTAQPDFSISAGAVSPLQILAGSSGTSTITVTALNGFTGQVNTSVSASSPVGLTCTIPASVTFGTSPQTATLSCSVSVAGDYTVTVTGTAALSPFQTHTTSTILFHVTDYTIAAGAVTPAQILAGASGTSTITLTAVNGFTGTVNLSVSASTPAGLTCTLPASVTFGTSPQTGTLSCSTSVAGDYTVTVTGASGTLSHTSATILFHVVDFTIAPSSPVTVNGNTASPITQTITLTALNGFTGTVTLSVSVSSPSGLSCTLPASVVFGTSPQTTTLSCSSPSAGDFVVTVTGASGTLSHATAAITFHVVVPVVLDFSISAGPVAPSQILAGSPGTSTITVTALNGFTGTVNLSVSASTPAGLTCTIPASITFGNSPQTATLSCSATGAGDYSVMVTGTSGTLSHSTGSILFHVTDYTIAPSSPVTVSINIGVAGTQTISLTALNGFTGTVTLSVSASSPAGLVCGIDPSVVFGGSPQTATLSCSSPSQGDFVVTATGTSGTLSHTTASITFHVTPAPPAGFSISAGAVSPSQIPAGSSGASTITLTSINGFTGTVALSVSDSTPVGLACTIPASVTFGSSPQTATLSCSAASAGDYTVTVTGSSGTLSHTTSDILFHVVDFDIAASPTSVNVNTGLTSTSTITVTALNGFTGTVSLSVSPSSPAGLTCTLPASVTLGSSPQIATLACSSPTAGDFVVTVTGTSGALSHSTAAITFHVVAVPDFSLSAGPVAPSQILAGASGSSMITVTAINGFAGTVNLSVSASTPSGLTCTLPASVTFGTSPQTATLSCSASAAGDYTVTVAGTTNVLNAACSIPCARFTGSILFHVTDFTIAAGPVSPSSITTGSSGSSTITLTGLNGFTGTVSLSVSDSTPAGLTCTLSATSVTFGGSPQTFTLSCTTTVAGDYTVTVTGTSGTLSHSTGAIAFHFVTVSVNDFTISANPTQLTIEEDRNGRSVVTVRSNGFSGIVTFKVKVSPSIEDGLEARVRPRQVFLPFNGSNRSNLLIFTNDTPAGTYTITVTATSGTLSHTVQVTVNVLPDGDDDDTFLTALPMTMANLRGQTPPVTPFAWGLSEKVSSTLQTTWVTILAGRDADFHWLSSHLTATLSPFLRLC